VGFGVTRFLVEIPDQRVAELEPAGYSNLPLLIVEHLLLGSTPWHPGDDPVQVVEEAEDAVVHWFAEDPAARPAVVGGRRRYDPNAGCPKCGSLRVTVAYRPAGRGLERMERSCSNCHYRWEEAPLDVGETWGAGVGAQEEEA
jgi:hypothetical protein